jgi:hypothetical protein
VRIPAQGAVRNLSRTDIYGAALLFVLAAYAIAGRGFAYVGVAPLYISEIMLGLGLLTLLRTRAVLATLTVIPAMLVAALLLLVMIRTEPYLSVYGMDAARDSVIVVYSVYAFVVAGLILEQPSRVSRVVRFLRSFSTVYVFVGPIGYLVGQLGSLQSLPAWPGSPAPVLALRPGELAVHLSACAVMAILRLRQANVVWTIMLFLGIAIVASHNRGGFLAILIPVGIALSLSGRWRGMIKAAVILSVAMGLAYAVDLKMPTYRDDGRDVGARQIVDNLISLAVPSENKELDDTKRWRQAWWAYIADYTFHGQYFWSGKGFGVNLADADGFQLGEDSAGGNTLRSPHNSHLTILARTGVPGIVLWGSFAFSWMWMVLACARRAWSFQDEAWGNLLLFTACYWLSILIDASFDVVLEGPMLGIWFWSLTGFGFGLVMVYRSAIRHNTQWSLRMSYQSAKGRRAARNLRHGA